MSRYGGFKSPQDYSSGNQTYSTVRKSRMKNLMSCSALFLLALAGAAALQKRTDSGPTEGLHQVLLALPGDKLGHCGGALISPEWVLTAAHCDAKDTEVIVGHHPGLKGERRRVTETKMYSEGKTPHNIMLLRVEKKPKDKFSTVPLPPESNCKPPATKVVQFYGWIMGKYNPATDQILAEKLQKGELTVAPCRYIPEQEKQIVPMQLQHQAQKLLCATHPPGVSDCELLAGTSLLSGGVLHGVLMNYDVKCQKQVEFMDVCGYRKWIKSIARV